MALERYGVSRETYNSWRRALNLTPMNENGSHVGIRTESQAARQPAPAPAPARKPLKRSKRTLDLTEEDTVVKRGGKRSLRLSDDKSDLTYDQMITRINSLTGTDALKSDGSTSRGHSIAPKSLSDWKRNMTTIMNHLACDKGSVSACFGVDKAQANIDKIKEKYPKYNTLKTMYSAIVSTAKYIPEFKAAIGVQAFDMYKEAMHEASRKAQEEHVEKTGEETVPDIEELKKKVIEIPQDTEAYLSSWLQINLTGLRNDLGSVRVLDHDNDKKTNWYNSRTGRLVINKFKTSKYFDPYKFQLPKEIQTLIKTLISKRKSRTDMLVSRKDNNSAVKAAFKKLKYPKNITANTIRHSQISKKIQQSGATLATVRANSKVFKHDVSTDLSYSRAIQEFISV